MTMNKNKKRNKPDIKRLTVQVMCIVLAAAMLLTTVLTLLPM